MVAARLEAALGVALPRRPRRAGEGRARQRGHRGAVLLEEPGLRGPLPVVRLPLRGGRAALQKPAVERLDVVEGGDRDEQVAPERPHLVLHAALLVARVGVGEAVVEAVVGGERPEERRRHDLGADPAADLGGVVEHRPRRHAAGELERGAQPVAHAFGRLAPEHLGEPDVGVRELDHQVVAPPERPADAEVRLAEVDLALAGAPIEDQVPLGLALPALPSDPLPRGPDEVPDRLVGALEALLLDEPVVDAPRGVALLAPHAQVLPEPSLDRLGVGLHHRRRRPAARRRRPGGQVPRRDVLPHRRARDAGRGGYAADRLAPPGPPPDILYLVHADHFLSGPPNVEIGSHRQLSVQGGGRRGPYHFGKFSFTGMESGLYHFRKSDVTKYTRSSRHRAKPVGPLS